MTWKLDAPRAAESRISRTKYVDDHAALLCDWQRQSEGFSAFHCPIVHHRQFPIR
jgi:hypothetical protein